MVGFTCKYKVIAGILKIKIVQNRLKYKNRLKI